MLTWRDIARLAEQGDQHTALEVEKTDDEWREQLTPEQYSVTRRKGTEQPFSSAMCALFEPGLYACVCCGQRLFDADGKFDSGTGWPSFTQPIEADAIAYHTDASHGMVRVETTCNRCGAHLGHVFPDGPQPTGLRYCMNSASLRLEKDEG